VKFSGEFSGITFSFEKYHLPAGAIYDLKFHIIIINVQGLMWHGNHTNAATQKYTGMLSQRTQRFRGHQKAAQSVTSVT